MIIQSGPVHWIRSVVLRYCKRQSIEKRQNLKTQVFDFTIMRLRAKGAIRDCLVNMMTNGIGWVDCFGCWLLPSNMFGDRGFKVHKTVGSNFPVQIHQQQQNIIPTIPSIVIVLVECVFNQYRRHITRKCVVPVELLITKLRKQSCWLG